MTKTLQQEISEWAEETFPDSTLSSVMGHLDDELTELNDACWQDSWFAPPPKPHVEEECADVLHLLFQVATLCRFDLLEATRNKFEKNKKRTWGAPDANGVVRHVKENTDNERLPE